MPVCTAVCRLTRLPIWVKNRMLLWDPPPPWTFILSHSNIGVLKLLFITSFILELFFFPLLFGWIFSVTWQEWSSQFQFKEIILFCRTATNFHFKWHFHCDLYKPYKISKSTRYLYTQFFIEYKMLFTLYCLIQFAKRKYYNEIW